MKKSDLSRPRMRQLQQLRKLDPVAYHRAAMLLEWGYVFSASALIGAAMKALLKHFSTSTGESGEGR